MKISRKQNDDWNIKLSGINLQKVEKFTYQGTVTNSNGKIQTEISKRIEKSLKVYNLTKQLIWNRDVTHQE